MKKQIAVLMAAATAVTTVAPAIANADVTNYDSSLDNMVKEAKKALDTKYKNRLSNGIEAEPMGSIDSDDDYLNSRYVVLVSGCSKNAADKAGFKTYKESAYAKYTADANLNFDFEVADGVHISTKENDYYVVDDSYKLRTLLESELGKDVKLTVVDKGATKDGESYNEFKEKHYVSEIKKGNDDVFANDTRVSLDDTATMLYYLARKEKATGVADDETPTFVDTLKITTKNGGEKKYVDDKFRTSEKPAGKDTTFFGQGVTKIKLKLTSGKELTLENGDLAIDVNSAFEGSNEIKLFKKDIDNNEGYAFFKDIKSKLKGENTQDVMDGIDSFGKYENKDNQVVKVDVKTGDTDVYTLEDVQNEEIQLKDIYTREGGYTQEGADFVNAINNAKVVTNLGNGKVGFQFNFRGHNYLLADGNEDNKNSANYQKPLVPKKTAEDDEKQTVQQKKGEKEGAIRLADAKIDKVADGYKLTLDVRVVDGNDLAVYKVLRFEIFGAQQKDLYDIVRDLNGKQNVVAGHFVKLAGSNRYETAIAVSQEGFAPATAKSVVIVGGHAQLDGLSAAPLASAKYAPILLADPNTGLSDATIKEIARACVYNGYTQENVQYNNVKNLKNKTVYIVGGEKSVPAIVEKQLKDKFGVTVVRLSGMDRVATSLDVAKRLTYDGNTNGRMFFVGAEGAADAMSVAGVAAQRYEKDVDKNGGSSIKYVKDVVSKAGDKVSPILVVPKAGLTRDIRNFLVQDASNDYKVNDKINNLGQIFNEGYVIGGENSVATQVVKDVNLAFKLKGEKNSSVSRVSGEDRYATNVEVLNTFYMNRKLADDPKKADEKVVGNFDKITVNGAVFASGKTQYLVDAQTSGAFAAYHDMPIVLTDNKLTKDQVDLMDINGILHDQRAYIYQVGGVVSADAMKTVVDKLSL